MRFVHLLSAICFVAWGLVGCAAQQSTSTRESPAAVAMAESLSEDQSIDALLRMSSTNRLLAGIDHWMIGRIQQQFNSVSETTLMPIFESAMENFSKETLLTGVKVSVAQHYHSQYMSRLMSWYGTGVGKAYSSRSKKVDTTSPEFKHWFETADFDTESAGLIRTLMEVSQALEMVETRMLVPHQGMSIGWQQARRRAGIASNVYSESSITTQVTKAQNVAVMCAMFAYRDLDVSQLRAIIAFESTPAAHWYYEAIHSGIQNALFQASRRMSEGITRSVMLRVEREMPET